MPKITTFRSSKNLRSNGNRPSGNGASHFFARAGAPPPASEISIIELNEAQTAFSDNYFLTGKDAGFSKSFMIKWNDLMSQIITPITTAGSANFIDPSSLALKFIHRYDSANNAWFLTVATCAMQSIAGTSSFNITEQGPRFDLSNGVVISPSTLASPLGYDSNYFNNLYDANGNALDASKHVNSIVFPWQAEILEMYSENYSLAMDINTVYLVFDSCSFYVDQTVPSSYSLVSQPHGIVMYLNINGVAFLNDVSSVLPFYFRASDFGTLCPPRCSFYDTPSDL